MASVTKIEVGHNRWIVYDPEEQIVTVSDGKLLRIRVNCLTGIYFQKAFGGEYNGTKGYLWLEYDGHEAVLDSMGVADHEAARRANNCIWYSSDQMNAKFKSLVDLIKSDAGL
ncbi:hypothetical protein ACUH89_06445 [Dermabacteraceae bacterium P13264]